MAGLKPTPAGRRASLRRQATRDTAPELALRRALRARGLSHYRLQRELLPGSRRRVDLAFIGAKVAVDVRGCFWHGCSEHHRSARTNEQWWREKVEKNVARDIDTEERLREAGWEVIVVWEHEEPMMAAERISRLVRSRTAHRSAVDSPADALDKWTRLWGEASDL